MKVYHGSYTKIDKINLSKSIPSKDFGKGFYVTKIRSHAESWAKVIGSKNDTEGFVTEFEYIDGDFTESICKIKRFDAYNDEWLEFIVQNRNRANKAPVHDYDIVEGPVANDKIQNTLRLYLKGKIPKDKFLKMLSKHTFSLDDYNADCTDNGKIWHFENNTCRYVGNREHQHQTEVTCQFCDCAAVSETCTKYFFSEKEKKNGVKREAV